MRRELRSGVSRVALTAACLTAISWCTTAGAADVRPAVPGRIIADFTLNDALGAKRSLAQWKDAKAVVVVFLGTECPLAKLYGKRLGELDRQYASQGVQFVGINSNQQDTLQELLGYGRKHGIDFPLLKDAGARIADEFGATRTPEAFVLDRQRAVRYHGRIDDQYGVGAARNAPLHSELVDALDAVLAGKPVGLATTTPVGCLIGRREANPSQQGSDVTYAKQIAPLMQKHCVSCHRAGQIAPFALTEYADVAAWSDTMLEVIDAGRMPPWHANPAHGDFLNDARMTDDEKALFRRWIAAGVPEGNPSDAPPLPVVDAEWQVPEPRTVFRMPEPYNVPATGTVPYQYFEFDPKFTEDKWVYSAEARPGNREVVHHLLLFYLPPGREQFRPQDPLFNAVAAFAPGMPAIGGPEEWAVRIPAGSKLIFQVHYTPNGTATTDQSEAALAFADPAKVAKQVRIEAGLNFKFLIPPWATDYQVKQDLQIARDTLLFTITPHMHYRGKSFKFTASYPDGKEEVLLDVPRYDFNWQNTYLLREPKRLPGGTVIHMEAHYDNSANNPLNPDPRQSVHWGDQTWDEMMLGSLTVGDADQDLRLGMPRVEAGKPDDPRQVTFRFKPPASRDAAAKPIEAVYLTGDFRDWNPTALKMNGPDAEGFYSATEPLDAGRHEYKFTINGSEWYADPAGRDFAGYYGNSVLDVR